MQITALLPTVALLFAAPAFAQGLPPFPGIPVVADGSLGTLVTASTLDSTRTILIDGGKFSGPEANPYQTLYHSFDRFALETNDVALWTNSQIGSNVGQVRTIINRVTGGTQSTINGRLNTSQFANADLFLLNPAGVVFGPGFSLSIPGSLYVSTAQELRFSDDKVLLASTGNGSTLSVGSPESFGFLGTGGADINFTGGAGLSQTGASLSFVGGNDVAHFSAANLKVNASSVINDAQVRLVATGEQAVRVPVDPAAPLDGYQGTLAFEGASLTLGGPTINRLTGANAVLKAGAGTLRIETNDFSRAAAGIQSIAGGDILLNADHVIMAGMTRLGILNQSPGSASLLHIIAGKEIVIAGDDPLNPDAVEPRNGEIDRLAHLGSVRSERDGGPAFNPGSALIRLDAPAGSIAISHATIDAIANNANSSAGFSASAQQFSLSQSTIGVSAVGLLGSRRGGDIAITADRTIIDTGALNTFASGQAAAGNIAIKGGDIRISASTMTSSAADQSPGSGQISLDASRLLRITSASGSGNTGTATVITTGSRSGAPTSTPGAGAISLRGASIELVGTRSRTIDDNDPSGRVRIAAQTTSDQSGGNISLMGEARVVLDKADIIAFTGSVRAAANTGASGDIAIRAGDIALTGSYITSSSSSAGNPGAITLTARNAFSMSGASVIEAAASHLGAAGSVNVSFGTTGDIGVGSTITTDLSGPAPSAGSINIEAPSGALTIRGNGQSVTGIAGLRSSSGGASKGGNIRVNVNRLSLLNGGIIADSTAGDGGQITINAASMEMREGAFVSTNSLNGRAGDIRITLPDDALLFLSGDQVVPRIATTSRQNSGGRIIISNPYAIIARGSAIEALGPGNDALAELSLGYRILAFDRPNAFDVAGRVFIQGQNSDVSRGTQIERPELLDTYRVLVGRCAHVADTLEVSGLTTTLNQPGAGSPIGPARPGCGR